MLLATHWKSRILDRTIRLDRANDVILKQLPHWNQNDSDRADKV